MREISPNTQDLDFVKSELLKITSPSTVSDDIKAKIAANPDFFEKGSELYIKDGQSHCPFCSQSTAEPKVQDNIAAYLGYFADAEGKHKKELKDCWARIKRLKETLNRVVEEKTAAFFLHKINAEHKLSKHSRYVAPFEHYLLEVFDVHNGREPQPTTCNAVRCVLEAVGRFCHPHKCDNLSNYITFLAGEEEFEIKSVLINNLSHGSYYDETPSPEEIKEACDEIIAIVEKYAVGQLEIVRALYEDTKVKPIAAVA